MSIDAVLQACAVGLAEANLLTRTSMPRWSRILIGCGVGIVAIFAYLRFFGCQTILAVDAWYSGWENPILWKVSVELTDHSISKSPGRRLYYLGYDFEVPWDDLDTEHTKRLRAWQVISFQSGKAIVFMGHEPDGQLKDLGALKAFRREEVIPERYGYDYTIHHQILDASPYKITPFMSRREAVGAFGSLTLKQAFMLDGDSSIFLNQTPYFRGFQYGNPESGDREIRDELYSQQGSIGFIFRSRSSLRISQAEINRVIQTVAPTIDQSSRSETTGAQPPQ